MLAIDYVRNAILSDCSYSFKQHRSSVGVYYDGDTVGLYNSGIDMMTDLLLFIGAEYGMVDTCDMDAQAFELWNLVVDKCV